MKKFLALFFNTIFFLLVILITIAISTLAMTRKINEYANQYALGLSGSVVKEAVPVIALTKGIVTTVNITTGNAVKKGDILVVLSNPALQNEFNALKQYPSNLSAKTQADVDKQQLDLLTVIAPADGIIGDINVSVGSPVDSLTKLLTMYSNKNIRFLADVTVDQYQAIRHASRVTAYSARLNQSFGITPDILNPNEKTPLDFEEKKIGLYFTFQNNHEAISLLHNEDLKIQVTNAPENPDKPINIIVNFWNKLIK